MVLHHVILQHADSAIVRGYCNQPDCNQQIFKSVAIGAEGLGFDYWAGQIELGVASRSPPLL